jgi:MATE family multidrug resistance protein
MSFKQKYFGNDAREKFRHFFSIMIPILITQTAIMGMNFIDTVMSGHAGAEQLAGVSIGTNVWMPVFTTINGILIAATPLTAHLLGAGKKAETGRIIRHGLLLALLFSALCFAAGFFFLEPFIRRLGLEPQVAHIAKFYLAGIGTGIIPFFMGTVLRSFIDTLGGTRLTMQVYLATLPINVVLNYILIFGKLGIPPLGGIGAGIGTGITCWILFVMFTLIICRHPLYRNIKILSEPSCGSQPASGSVISEKAVSSGSFSHSRNRFNKALLLEYLRIGIPIGLSIFMETSIFGVVAFLVARFGTAAIAASQASMNFAGFVYMLPLSVSMSMTILIGIEAGARRWIHAEQYANAGMAFNWTCALLLPFLCYLLRYPIARMYVTEPEVIEVCVRFIIYGCLFIMGDAVAAPIQGILRGYKDVNAPFYSSLIAYWGICFPLGLFFDYRLNHGPYSYWQSLDIGLFASALILFLRLLFIRKKIRASNDLARF